MAEAAAGGPDVVGWTPTVGFVIAGWVLFRAADFQSAAAMLYVLLGGAGFGGKIIDPGLIVAAALVAVLVPSAHEIRNMRPMPWPMIAAATAALAAFCVLEVGIGPPLNFIYFQF